MNITEVTTEQRYRYLPLKGWDSVAAALKVFAKGVTKGSRETEKHQLQAIGDAHGGFALAFYGLAAPHLHGNTSRFVERMLAEAQKTLQNYYRWSRSYDYDGVGSFFKTDVVIEVIDWEAEIYALGIWAAYVGDEPEIGLAEHLEIPRALMSSQVIVHVEPADEEHFAFDFEQLVRKLDDVLNTRWAKGTEIAELMMLGDRLRKHPDFTLYSDDDVIITLDVGRVENRFVYDEPGKARDTWAIEGSVLTGLLDESYEDRTKKETPTMVISIVSAQSEKYRTKPIYHPDKKQAVLNLTERIADVLRPRGGLIT